MASDVILELLDRDAVETLTCENDQSMDELLVKVADICHITPVARGLFAFRQGGRWLSPSTTVGTLGNTQHLQLRLRYKMPGFKMRGMEREMRRTIPTLKNVDPKAFQYFYSQVRRDFDCGLVWNKKVVEEKGNKWWVPIIQSGVKDKREEKLEQLNIIMLELVGRNMAIDVIDGAVDKKEALKNVKTYIPKDLYSGLEKMMAVKLLQPNVERLLDKLLKAYQPKMSSMQIKADFLNLAEKFFPNYFCESFSAKYDDGGNVLEVRLIVSPAYDDQQVTLSMLTRGEVNKKEVATIDQICNIAVQDPTNIEISRKNGVPLYFQLDTETETTSFLALLCGYYRAAEKWTFSLCTELRFPILSQLLASKVHGPVERVFAEEKLKNANFQKGSYLVRQCTTDHHKLFLHFCSRDGCKPEEVTIVEENGLYRLQEDQVITNLPAQLREQFRSVGELIMAVRTVPSSIELANCVHPSEFDRPKSLLLCRTDHQWREDTLGNKLMACKEKVYIHPKALSKYPVTLAQGTMCCVWKGIWHKSAKESKIVAIKQLDKSRVGTHLPQFLSLVHKAFMWDDGSLASAEGHTLPVNEEPPVLVTEYFQLGPLPAYLNTYRATIQPVDLLEAATCLARALHYLEDNSLVHGDIRAKNMFVSLHTDSQFKVKLCEGGLEGPGKEDVHWLDFQQLHTLLASEHVQPSPQGDVWSFGTTLWEIFSLGQVPLPGVCWEDAAKQYIAGYRLPWPGTSHLATPLHNIMKQCWQPVQGQRKQPQAIMRDINQLLYKVFNSRRNHEYVTIDVGPPSPSTPATLTPDQSVSISTRSSFSMDLASPPVTQSLVPVFTDISRKLMEKHNLSEFGSSSPLINDSRSSSSLAGSMFNTDMSAITCQTSLDWGSLGDRAGLYSMSSIYQLEDSDIEYNTEFPLGEGNFGVVYKGVRTKSDGDWEQVAIKMIKDTDTMSNSAHDDMEREVNLMKNLSHENIVKIKGVRTVGPSTIIVMEFIREGSLDRFLHVNRHNLDYPKQLFGYSQNIVDGMEYLTRKGIIHRDLAARNILVADQETVKISDFGLARQASNSDVYVMTSTTNVPVKWEAIECLTHRKYSQKSDVWSFGVTLWEMFAFGASPALAGCEDFFTSYDRQRQDFRDWLSKLEEGVRLPQTELCPNYLYSRVMRDCWKKDPQTRPTFSQLKDLIKKAELEVT